MPGHFVEDNDPIAIYEAAGETIARAREGKGPSLIEIETYRLAGHFMGDAEGYRPEGEKDALFAKDPIPQMSKLLLDEGHADEAAIAELQATAQRRVDEAIVFARESEYAPEEEALTSVFA